MSYTIKNMYVNRFESGGLIVKDLKADQELLKVNKITYVKTYDIKEDLKKYGFKFNPHNKKMPEWVLYGLTTSEEATILEELKNKYVVEVLPQLINYKRYCYMCGSYYYSECDCTILCKL